MMRPDAKVEKVYLYPKPVDFRKSIDGLAVLVELDYRLHRGGGGLCWCTFRHSRADGHGTLSQADFPAVRSALRQRQQKRFRRCRGELRSRFAPVDALCLAQNRGPADAFRVASPA